MADGAPCLHGVSFPCVPVNVTLRTHSRSRQVPAPLPKAPETHNENDIPEGRFGVTVSLCPSSPHWLAATTPRLRRTRPRKAPRHAPAAIRSPAGRNSRRRNLQTITVTGSALTPHRRGNAFAGNDASRPSRSRRAASPRCPTWCARSSADNSGSIPASFTAGFAAGSSGVALRGLTVNSTLVLIDGRRAANYPLADDGQRFFRRSQHHPVECHRAHRGTEGWRVVALWRGRHCGRGQHHPPAGLPGHRVHRRCRHLATRWRHDQAGHRAVRRRRSQQGRLERVFQRRVPARRRDTHPAAWLPVQHGRYPAQWRKQPHRRAALAELRLDLRHGDARYAVTSGRRDIGRSGPGCGGTAAGSLRIAGHAGHR